MLLANLNMVPFTGKNVYLFGLDSGGDVMESSVLLALGVWSSCRAERAVPLGQPKPLAPRPHHPAHEYV
jgi:hypothetical protein